MSDPRIRVYKSYLAAWSAIPDDERVRLLRESLADTIAFTNSQKTRHGLDDVAAHLAEFQRHMPGASFKLNEMLGWESHALATWQLVDPQGKAGFWGYDVLSYDAQGRVESILMFTHMEKQMVT